MMSLASDVLTALAGKTLATAESCTGGGIGQVLTAIPGSSAVYKGGIISYCDEIKARLLGVDPEILEHYGAVSTRTAAAMAAGARRALKTDIAISVTGLAGPGGDGSGHPVGTVFIGYEATDKAFVRHFIFSGDREAVRQQAIRAALELILESQ